MRKSIVGGRMRGGEGEEEGEVAYPKAPLFVPEIPVFCTGKCLCVYYKPLCSYREIPLFVPRKPLFGPRNTLLIPKPPFVCAKLPLAVLNCSVPNPLCLYQTPFVCTKLPFFAAQSIQYGPAVPRYLATASVARCAAVVATRCPLSYYAMSAILLRANYAPKLDTTIPHPEITCLSRAEREERGERRGTEEVLRERGGGQAGGRGEGQRRN